MVLTDLLADLFLVQERMSAKNSHRQTVRTAIEVLIAQAERISDLRQAQEEKPVSAPMVTLV